MSLRQTSKTCHQASFWNCKDATFGINEFPRSAVQMKRISNLVPREKALETKLKNTQGHRVQIGKIVLTNSVSQHCLQWKALLYVRYLAAKSRVYGFFVGLFTLNISNLILESLVKFGEDNKNTVFNLLQSYKTCQSLDSQIWLSIHDKMVKNVFPESSFSC